MRAATRLNHEALENNVSIDTRNARPGTVGPGITRSLVAVVHVEGVLVVGRSGQAVLIGTLLVGGERRTGDKDLGTAQNLVGLLVSPAHALLGHRDVDLAGFAGDSAHRHRNYVLTLTDYANG